MNLWVEIQIYLEQEIKLKFQLNLKAFFLGNLIITQIKQFQGIITVMQQIGFL